MSYFYSILIQFSLILLLFGCTESNNSKSNDTHLAEPDEPVLQSNSFSHYFRNSNINYSYTEKTQTHDYSNNWDFDGDGKKDSIRFEGDNGSHLHFYLVVGLSSKSSPQYFDWIYTDTPLFHPEDSLPEKSTGYLGINFVVHDFNGDLLDDIFINVGDYGQGLPIKFEELGFHDSKIVLIFDRKSSKFIVREWWRESI